MDPKTTEEKDENPQSPVAPADNEQVTEPGGTAAPEATAADEKPTE